MVKYKKNKRQDGYAISREQENHIAGPLDSHLDGIHHPLEKTPSEAAHPGL